ncbi:MAG TPA: ADOP family duplicated permease [Gemmatimonadaceae bacterium]|nr:ADOP family duplicated permease [Gemmatimonadaceae bacterium]
MTFLRPGIRRLLKLDTWRGRGAERDVMDEMELHIALRAEQLERDGMTAASARDEARRLFAQHDTTIRELRDAALDRNRHMRSQQRWEAAWQDTRYAARRLIRDAATTAFILGTLALGIGINVTAFSVVDRVLLRGPQHVREPDRLVRFYTRVDRPSLGQQTMPWLPYTAFTALRDGMRSIDGIGAYRLGDMMVGSGAASEMRRVSLASPELFPLLGVRPFMGRFFAPDEDAANVVVVSERFWRTVLASDPGVVGRSLAIDDVPHTVIGVAPGGFTGVELARVDAWTPISRASRNSQNMEIVARLRRGVSIEAAVADVDRLRPSVEASLPKWAGWLVGARYLAAPIGYDDTARESFEAVMARWLAAISAMILLISCANVANLLLARLARRRRELAVRVALGSGRSRVMRLLALEGALLAIGAAIVALVVILLVEPIVQRALFPAGSWAFSLADAHILGAVALVTVMTGLLVAVVPAIQAGNAAVGDALRGGNRGGETPSLLRPGLTIVQAMLSVVLLIGAGLFLRSLQRASAVQLGMEPDRVLTVELRYPRPPRAPGESFSDWLGRGSVVERARYRALVDVARRVSGVERAAVSVGVPFYGAFTVGLWVPGRDSIPALPGGGPYITAVGADYFATMGTPIREGRAFDAGDREGSEPVVIVGEAMARTLWPGRGALGACVIVGKRDAPCARVVGVAADIHRSGLKEEPSMQYYVPIGQERGFSGSYLLVRPNAAATTSWSVLREALQKADPAIASIDVRPLSQGLDGETRPFRLGLIAFGLGAVLALIVAALGLYSIMAHAVAWRRHEIGVRLALGARPQSIAALVVSRGTKLATLGIGAGLVVALAARPWVEPRLFETSARDPLVLGGVVVLLELVALLAGWVPARRAVSVSPTEALRAE